MQLMVTRWVVDTCHRNYKRIVLADRQTDRQTDRCDRQIHTETGDCRHAASAYNMTAFQLSWPAWGGRDNKNAPADRPIDARTC